ncbi:MAG: hypothetical protein LBU68_02205, partial [Rickettsiales bacterium]|nr:hypothetical protein [Rickettsiales bacterium]
MTSYQYYNQIKGYISGKEEFSSVEDNQLKYALNCLKELHNGKVNLHNSHEDGLSFNTKLVNMSQCGGVLDNEEDMFTVKLCILDDGTIATGTEISKTCFAQPTSKQFVISILNSSIEKSQYALLLNENASFVTENSELRGPAGSVALESGENGTLTKIKNFLKAQGIDLIDKAVIIHAATTEQVLEEIEKKKTEEGLDKYDPNAVCPNREALQATPPSPSSCFGVAWGWVDEACRWYCPKMTQTARDNLDTQKCGSNLLTAVLESNDVDLALYKCLPNFEAAEAICKERFEPDRYPELVSSGNEPPKVVCAARKKSEAGCSICQIPVLNNMGEWSCSAVRPNATGGAVPTSNETKTIIAQNWGTTKNADVTAIQEAKCLANCTNAITGVLTPTDDGNDIVWDEAQKLWKCIECPTELYDAVNDTCSPPKCTGNLMYNELVGRCVPIKWCALSASEKANGLFIGDADGICIGHHATEQVKYKAGNESITGENSTLVTFSTLFRKAYNPIKQCYYCRISIPVPIGGPGANLKQNNIINDIMNNVFDSIAGFINNTDFNLISSAYAQDETGPLGDKTDENKYDIAANNYPPYSNINDPSMLDLIYNAAMVSTNANQTKV